MVGPPMCHLGLDSPWNDPTMLSPAQWVKKGSFSESHEQTRSEGVLCVAWLYVLAGSGHSV